MFENVVVMDDCEDNDLQTHYYLGVPIVTPRMSIAFAVRKETEEFIRARVSPGKYKDVELINDLLKDVFKFLNDKISFLIDKISSRDVMEFLYLQYSLSCRVEALIDENPYHKDAKSWRKGRPCLRRSLKFLIEKMAETYDGDKQCPFEGYFADFETLLELTECSFFFSLLSSSTFGVSKERTVLEIFEPNENPFMDYINLWVEGYNNDMFQRGNALFHAFNRKNGSPLKTFPDYFQKESEVAFKELAGDSYDGFWSILGILRDCCIPGDNGVCFIPTLSLKNGLAKNYEISPKCVDLFFKTFSLTQGDLKQNPREIFKTKQRNRLKMKFILQLEWNGVTHSMFTHEIMSEGTAMLLDSLSYNGLPEPWETKKMKKCFADISRHFGHEFEEYCCMHLRNWGFIGHSYKKALPCGVSIPDNPGEIDFLGYSEEYKCITIFEFKNVKYSTDPLEFRDDLDEFVNEDNSYLKKFRRKIAFVKENVLELCRYFKEKKSIEMDCSRIIAAIITYAPNISKYYIEECKCLSLAEFEVEWKENPWQFMIEV